MGTIYLKMRNSKVVSDLFFFEKFYILYFIKWVNYEIWLVILANLLELLVISPK
jgi:hypothetical protein